MTFSSIGLAPSFLKALEKEGYVTPTPIQEKAIPVILDGRDVLGCAQTGTGKTAAFALPILQLLSEKKSSHRVIRSIILSPTRELAIQIQQSFETYGQFTHLKTAVIFGGVSQFHQVETIKKGVDILIATPGRLLDLLSQNLLSLKNIEIFVLDEADIMLDMGFIHDIKKIVKELPAKRQTLFFSATMAPAIQTLAGALLKTPEKIAITPVATPASTITQHVYHLDKGRKNDLLFHLLQDEAIKNVLVFTKSKHGADKIVKFLQGRNITAEAIHGNKSQNNRQKALSAFKDQSIRVLVATDIASRGIDIDQLEYMINFDIPNISESYVHRIGRTGRAGASGTAISFCTHEDLGFLRDIEKLTGVKIRIIENHPFPKTDFTVVTKTKNPGHRRPHETFVATKPKTEPSSFEKFKAAKAEKKNAIKKSKSKTGEKKKYWFAAPPSGKNLSKKKSFSK